jgi:hypothetical protein
MLAGSTCLRNILANFRTLLRTSVHRSHRSLRPARLPKKVYPELCKSKPIAPITVDGAKSFLGYRGLHLTQNGIRLLGLDGGLVMLAPLCWNFSSVIMGYAVLEPSAG